jgi:hypothetical protein
MVSRKVSKKYGYEEYFINENQIKKLYNMYVDRHVLGKVLDIMVLVAIISTVMSLVMEFLGEVDNIVHFVVHSFSFLILLIFSLELLKHYAEAKTNRDFLKKHWIDFVLVAFLSFYFLFITFLDLLKFFIFDFLKPMFSDAKNARIFYNVIRKR